MEVVAFAVVATVVIFVIVDVIDADEEKVEGVVVVTGSCCVVKLKLAGNTLPCKPLLIPIRSIIVPYCKTTTSPLLRVVESAPN